MFKNKLKLSLALVMSLLVMTGCSANRGQVETVATLVEAVPVSTSQVVSDDVYESVYTIGEVQASDSYQVNAMSQGDITAVNFEVGDYVNEGDILFTIETEDFEVDKNSKLTQALNGMSQAKLSLDNALSSLNDTKALYESGISSKAQLDGAQTQYDNAKISYQNAVTSYNSTKHTYDSMSDNYEIKAPVSGIITASNIIEDMFVTTQNSMTIEVVDAYKINANVPSKHINNVKANQAVEIYIPTLEQTFKGHVETVSINGKTGAYPVEIVLDEMTDDLRTGMYSELWIQISDVSEGLWIPSNALLQENGESFVYTAEGDLAQKVLVEVLSKRGDQVAIVSDLSSDQVLITYGKEYVMDGSKINIR
ncbi:efflux RND transporter periplasmic adaptor subunit [Acidaminobacter sp. JC074]|uniref:efflux RND transporter periplasmic adaptor subunit n=1 Tax=Acidaminobacter sp. JC074 TaxID=2530199 RepID=UPI001F0F70D8|nr:efflux RND transporter periplasmic adaptor subunit [Acidaminobacter sp. JC074]MCH4887418.1 efflux RND transporter periplasmic adaptor subunit [Acidaminobacter sp. JC074]